MSDFRWPSPAVITAIGGTVMFLLQMFGFGLPQMNAAETNRLARVENLGELRRCIDERDEYKEDWKMCMEEEP